MRFRQLATGVAVVSLLFSAPGATTADPATSAPGITGTADYTPAPAATFQSVTEDVTVTMDDGVALAATVTYPSADGAVRVPGTFPIVMSITPYGRKGLCFCGDGPSWATRGFVHVVIDTRGTGGSGGNLNENYFSPREAKDGKALVEHFGGQSYSNGKVGMIGGSYVGITQYLTAEQQPKYLAAIAPAVAFGDMYRDAFTHDGIPNLFFDVQYLGVQGGPGYVGTDLPNVNQTLAARTTQLLGTPVALAYLQHPNDDSFYKDRSPIYNAAKIKVPVLVLEGWRDGFVRSALEMYQALAKRPDVETRLYVDPCTHKGCGAPFAPTISAPGLDDSFAMQFEFMSKHLAGATVGERAKVRAYIQPATGQYVQAQQWPPAASKFTKYYLKNGQLTTTAPLLPGLKTYLTNPAAGLTMPLDEYGTVAASPYFPTDQQLAALDGVTWQSPALTADKIIAGPIQMKLNAASTATDTDWIVKVSDVAPDGTQSIITEGYLRAAHRELDTARSQEGAPVHTHTAPKALVPGTFYNFDIAVWPTVYKLASGHKLQLRLTSYDVPTHAPGSVDLTAGTVALTLPATNTVTEGGASASTVIVPYLG
ncbi:MAG: CocE/NonD family hydrolase [Nocardiaceae bacterium]|nr:CocE/NonD family hydrolase [Nocardiaceae bacterium]